MQSKVDQLVNDVKTFVEIILGASRMNSLWTQEGLAPMVEKFSELADEVSVLETERQRLSTENAKIKKDTEAAWVEIAKLAEENRNLQKQVQDLKNWNDNQAKMLIKREKRYFTDGGEDYAYTYEDIQTGMKYVEIRSGLLEEEQGYDYALKA
jgi:chromosome segregation ATPase